MVTIPEVSLRFSTTPDGQARPIPLLGMGLGVLPFTVDQNETIKAAVLHAIGLGYRHFDTAALYQSEEALGEAIAEALRTGLVQSRSEFFITSKLWCDDAHPDLVLPAIRQSLRKLKLDYLDLYLIHIAMRMKTGATRFTATVEDILPFDLISVWGAMEECQRLALAKSIGVCNFTCSKIIELLEIAKIPPAVNQVEMNPMWQQKKMRELCKEKGILVTAYSPLGGQDLMMGKNMLMDSQVIADIAKAKGKTVAQVSLRWVYEQGVSVVVKTLNKERIEENLKLFDWELSDEDRHKISQMPQCKRVTLRSVFSPEVFSKILSVGVHDIIED